MKNKNEVTGNLLLGCTVLRITPEFPIRIGRKAMTLGGDSSRAAIARSSAIRETKRLASIELAQDDRVQRPSKLWSGMHVSEPKAKSL